MKEKVNMGCLTGQDQEQVEVVHQRNVDHDFVSFLRIDPILIEDGGS